MKNFGFIKVASAIPTVHVANCIYNIGEIRTLMEDAAQQQVKIVSFPELSITGYTCADLFFQHLLLEQAEEALATLVADTKNLDLTAIVGMPAMYNNRLYNVAVVFRGGHLLGVVPKTFLPDDNEFYEKRWFSSGQGLAADCFITIGGQTVPFGTNLMFGDDEIHFAIEICEDLWVPQAPSLRHALNGAQILFNLSASNEVIGKDAYRRQMLAQQSGRCLAAYVFAGAGFGESSTDLVFAGSALIYENGTCLAESKRFSIEHQLVVSDVDVQRLNEDRMRSSAFIAGGNSASALGYRMVSCPMGERNYKDIKRVERPLPFVPTGVGLKDRCEEIFSIQVWGLAVRLYHTGIKRVVVGISGGLDSTLALLVCVRTFDQLGLPRKNIIGITMPGFGTTNRTHNNSVDLMNSLGVTSREINIKAACLQHFKDIGHDPAILDVTYENTQARERTQILMDIANKEGGLVIGTGDLSELALGWATYNGDQMSMYAVNTSVPKTLVRSLVRYVADNLVDGASQKTLLDVIDTPVSPELLPADDKGEIAQKTESIVGPYELHDYFLYYMLRFGFSPKKIFFLAAHSFAGTYDGATIIKWLRIFYSRFFQQQFKRSCMPDGPKVGSVNLSPRGDWRMPSDASAAIWKAEIESIGE